jgi:molybdopterin molybdotransferase
VAAVSRALAAEPLLPVETALQRLLAGLRPLGIEQAALERARGRVLARDVVSERQLPGCDNSAMDGYAVVAADTLAAVPGSAVVLPLRGEARAGAAIAELAPGTCMAIMTGAPIPRGADAVVRIEDTADRGDSVEIRVAATPGTFVRRAGEDVRPGMVMVPAGRRLRPVDLAACAGVGAVELTVHLRPRVAILGGGDEVVPAAVEPEPHQVADTNSTMLAAAVAEAGGEPVVLGIMADDPGAIRGHLRAAAECDLIISSAGVSVGAHDHVRDIVAELGGVDVWRIAMRPGKPLLLGDVAGTPFLGLPGNPVSSSVTFELFGRPAILTLQGATRVRRRRIAVRLGEEVSTPVGLETYVRVRLDDAEDGIAVAWLSGNQGSSMLRSLSEADALVMVPAEIGDCPAGMQLSALELT